MGNKATNFNEDMLEKLNDVLDFVTRNPYSSFYSKKYGSQNSCQIVSLEDFRKIPVLEKREFLTVPINERTCVDKKDIKYYSLSSGTSKAPIPAIVPHSSYYHKESQRNIFNHELFEKLGVTKVMLLLQPTMAIHARAYSIPNPPAIFIPGDIRNLGLMAKLIREAEIDGIATTPTVLDFLVDELSAASFDFSKIKWISLGSEFCSTLRFEYFRSKFPEAFFHFRYGNAEIGGSRHYRCKHLSQSGLPNVFHIDADVELVEIMDENGKPAEFGQVGEIFHTDLVKKAFPFIRYRLKDMGKLERKQCPCGNEITLTIDGRSGTDMLKTHGVTFHAELVSKAVASVQDVVEPRYQLHIHERTQGGKPKLELDLHLKLRSRHADEKKNFMLAEIIKEKVSTNLRLSASATLKQLVEQGAFLPLVITFVDSWDIGSGKTKNIISHFE